MQPSRRAAEPKQSTNRLAESSAASVARPAAKWPAKARTRHILEAIHTGLSYAEIGRRFGITGSAVGKIAAFAGLPPRSPVPRVTVECGYCGKPVTGTVTFPRKFCSKRCFYRNNRGKTRPHDPVRRARALKMRERICRRCRKKFLAATPKARRKFCGHACAGRARAKLTLGDLKRLKAALKSGRSCAKIAAAFRVTRQYVYYLAGRS